MRCDEMKEEQASEQARGLAGKGADTGVWQLPAPVYSLRAAATASASGPSLRSVGVPSTVDGRATTPYMSHLGPE